MPSSCLLQQRARLLQTVRSFFLARQYLEVDTPALLPVLIPESQIIPFRCGDLFLQTSPELCMKRLLARGFPRLFQICHCFRHGESGRYHLPEFTMLEWYHVDRDYRDLMAEVEALARELVAQAMFFDALDAAGVLHRGPDRISMHPPWQRITVDEAFRRYADLSAEQAIGDGRFDEILVTKIEPCLGRERPVFLCDYPVQLGSLARRRRDNPAVAERFELYIGGIELANGFSELVDPVEQRARFTSEIQSIQQDGRVAAMPEKFLEALDAMPPAAGIALGLDRLLMLLCGTDSITDVVPLAPEEL